MCAVALQSTATVAVLTESKLSMLQVAMLKTDTITSSCSCCGVHCLYVTKRFWRLHCSSHVLATAVQHQEVVYARIDSSPCQQQKQWLPQILLISIYTL
jgi:hypothetical protein